MNVLTLARRHTEYVHFKHCIISSSFVSSYSTQNHKPPVSAFCYILVNLFVYSNFCINWKLQKLLVIYTVFWAIGALREYEGPFGYRFSFVFGDYSLSNLLTHPRR